MSWNNKKNVEGRTDVRKKILLVGRGDRLVFFFESLAALMKEKHTIYWDEDGRDYSRSF